jgi:hypothetical protein
MPQKSILVPYPASAEPGPDHDPIGVADVKFQIAENSAAARSANGLLAYPLKADAISPHDL